MTKQGEKCLNKRQKKTIVLLIPYQHVVQSDMEKKFIKKIVLLIRKVQFFQVTLQF